MAANHQRGEVDIGSDGHAKTLRLTTNAACAVEALTGKTLGTVLAGTDKLSMLDVRAVVWMLLQPYHGAEFKTVESVGAWIDDIGLATVMQGVVKVLELNQPETGGAAQAAARPLEPPAGTGDGSLLRVVG